MSTFMQTAEEYLAIRRALGFKLARQGALLLKFAEYLDTAGVEVLTSRIAYSWARESDQASVVWQSQRLSVVRGFARHLRGIDPRTEIPSLDLIPARFKRAIPYLYTDAEIERLMGLAGALMPSLRAATYRTLIGLLAVTGMRVSEALGLDRDDIDQQQRTIMIRHGKGGKQRRIPVHTSTLTALADYAYLRDETHPHPKAPKSFFLTIRGTRPGYGAVGYCFKHLREQADLGHTGSPPRLHDMRHTFVLRTLLGWYRAGSDIEAQLPLLSAYLGHIDPVSTYWYFQAEPQLLQLAASRLECAWRKLP